MTSRRLKYVIVQAATNFPMAILLHESITHSQAVNTSQVKPLSAGFCLITDHGVLVDEAGSTSLDLNPQPGDNIVIEDTLALMGLIPPTLRSRRLGEAQHQRRAGVSPAIPKS